MATRNTSGEAHNTETRQPIEKIFSTEEVAVLTGKTPATIRRYARKGIIKRITAKGLSRGIGYTAASVRALVEGRGE